jgi:hypothetical protein
VPEPATGAVPLLLEPQAPQSAAMTTQQETRIGTWTPSVSEQNAAEPCVCVPLPILS